MLTELDRKKIREKWIQRQKDFWNGCSEISDDISEEVFLLLDALDEEIVKLCQIKHKRNDVIDSCIKWKSRTEALERAIMSNRRMQCDVCIKDKLNDGESFNDCGYIGCGRNCHGWEFDETRFSKEYEKGE